MTTDFISNQPLFGHVAQFIVPLKRFMDEFDHAFLDFIGSVIVECVQSVEIPQNLSELVGVFVIAASVHVDRHGVFVINQSEKILRRAGIVALRAYSPCRKP